MANAFKNLSAIANEHVHSPDGFTKALGTAFLEALERKKEHFLTPVHLAAAMLYPPSRKMQKFEPNERQSVRFFLAFGVNIMVYRLKDN